MQIIPSSWTLREWLLATAALLTTPVALAQVVIVGKSRDFLQKSPTVLVENPARPYTFSAKSSRSGLVLTIPGGASFPLLPDPAVNSHVYSRTFATKAAMDAAFPPGIYTVTGPGISSPFFSSTLGTDAYPVIPQLQGGNWNAGGALLLTSAAARTLTFNAFTGYGAPSNAASQQLLTIGNLSSLGWSSALVGLDVPVASSPWATLAVPASALPSNSASSGAAEYVNHVSAASQTDGTNSSLAVLWSFGSRSTFAVSSVSSGTGGNPPTITRQPSSQTVALGGTAVFSVNVTGVNPPGQSAYYDWRRNGDALGGSPRYTMAADGTLTITNVSAVDVGNFVFIAGNTGGQVFSDPATLTLSNVTRPTITAPPASQTLSVGQSATLTATASGSSTLLYQWLKEGALIPGAKSPTLSLSNVTTSTAGSYTVTVSNDAGFVTSDAAVVTVSAGPGISTQPQSQNVSVSAPVTFTVAASGTGLTYQWRKNGMAIPGATNPSFTITSAQTGDMGFYACTVSSGAGSTESATATLTVTGGTPSRPVNISTRATVTVTEPLTAGFVLSGAKTLLVRASGPALIPFSVPGTLSDPRLEIIPLGGNTPVASNDNWGAAPNLTALRSTARATGAFDFPDGSKDAAVLVTLPAGGYTAVVKGADGGTGIALIEVYDADPLTASGQLLNISARAQVGTGASALATGFVVAGVAPRQVLIRGVGPTLSEFSVPNAINDPRLTLIPSGANYSIATNDNWGGSTTLSGAFTAAGAFSLGANSKDAALLVRLPPGGYTAIVSGVGNTTGTAIVEVYDLVTTPSETGTSNNGGTPAAAPTIMAVSPASGPLGGGTAITITGTNFGGATSVTIGGVAATSVTVVNATTISAVTPAGTSGAQTVVITTPGGTATTSGAFNYVWYNVLAQNPDASIVTNATLRNAIIATGLPWRVRDADTQIEMLLVPPGTFDMGCSPSLSTPCAQDEKPVHAVTLTNAFYIGRYEVTQAQWRARMGTNPSFFQSQSVITPIAQVPNRPVESVTWIMVQGFLSATGLRLPTEAEWEYACRAGTKTAYHSMPGLPDGSDSAAQLGSIAWFNFPETRPVGLKASNALGLHDMLGNVLEFVNDRYEVFYYDSSPSMNPPGPSAGSDRVLRGGGFGYPSSGLRVSDRLRWLPDITQNEIGFRVARTP
jgi:formylglycine-generating enzyme required for sulfatase activity